jgi:hypothetical protein
MKAASYMEVGEKTGRELGEMRKEIKWVSG